MRDYTTARSLFGLLQFIGWSVVVIGAIVALVGLTGAASMRNSIGGLLALTAITPGLSLALAGLLLVAFVEIGRAGIDTAQNTQEILTVAKEQLHFYKVRPASSSNRAAIASAAGASAKAPAEAAPAAAAEPRPTPANAARAIGYAQTEHKTAAAVEESVTRHVHRGIEIRQDGTNYLVGDRSFTSAWAAREHIDRLQPFQRLALAPVIASRSDGDDPFATDERIR